jgi:quercetin dioxygenase-like cupin family protein
MSNEMAQSSRVMRFDRFRWSGVEPLSYKSEDDSWHAVTRHGLIGDSEGTPFHVRYFEVGPGGYTTYERHEHQHAVVVLRGRGEVRLGEGWEPLSFGDAVYVASNDPHQFRNVGDESFGFLCVVAAERDRPTRL